MTHNDKNQNPRSRQCECDHPHDFRLEEGLLSDSIYCAQCGDLLTDLVERGTIPKVWRKAIPAPPADSTVTLEISGEDWSDPESEKNGH